MGDARWWYVEWREGEALVVPAEDVAQAAAAARVLLGPFPEDWRPSIVREVHVLDAGELALAQAREDTERRIQDLDAVLEALEARQGPVVVWRPREDEEAPLAAGGVPPGVLPPFKVAGPGTDYSQDLPLVRLEAMERDPGAALVMRVVDTWVTVASGTQLPSTSRGLAQLLATALNAWWVARLAVWPQVVKEADRGQ